MLPLILLTIQVLVLLALAAGLVVVHVGPESVRSRVARFYASRIAHR